MTQPTHPWSLDAQVNGNTLTVTRGVDFTSVDSHDAGARVSTWFYTDAEPLFLAEINT